MKIENWLFAAQILWKYQNLWNVSIKIGEFFFKDSFFKSSILLKWRTKHQSFMSILWLGSQPFSRFYKRDEKRLISAQSVFSNGNKLKWRVVIFSRRLQLYYCKMRSLWFKVEELAIARIWFWFTKPVVDSNKCFKMFSFSDYHWNSDYKLTWIYQSQKLIWFPMPWLWMRSNNL